MMKLLLIVAVLQLVLGQSDEPLFLTKYLSRPAEGRAMALVKDEAINAAFGSKSYSGYFTLNASPKRAMYTWFIEAKNDPKNAPVVVWLQGGPGGSSLYGLFTENGPASVSGSAPYKLIPRKYSWTENFNMLYIDNPLGVGFSFTDDNAGFVTNETEVAVNMFETLTQFFTVFDKFAGNDFYISGESYAGKYIPASAFHIHNKIKAGQSKINLKGIAVGDGALSPLIQFTVYSDLLWNFGLCDENEKAIIQNYESEITKLILKEQWVPAFRVFDELLNGDFYPYHPYIYNITGLKNYFNMLNPRYAPNGFDQWLNLRSVKEALHVGNYGYSAGNSTVESFLLSDWMKDVLYTLPTLLENYRCLFYSGQVDMILGSTGTEKVLGQTPWSGLSAYKAAKKELWYLPENIAADGPMGPAGYLRTAKGSSGELYQLIVRNAGHIMPLDQPASGFDMINKFISNTPFGTTPPPSSQ